MCSDLYGAGGLCIWIYTLVGGLCNSGSIFSNGSFDYCGDVCQYPKLAELSAVSDFNDFVQRGMGDPVFFGMDQAPVYELSCIWIVLCPVSCVGDHRGQAREQ